MSSLLEGIGNTHSVKKYYDSWSSEYDQSLHQWNYKAPKQSVKILAQFIKKKPKYLLDLACGTGLFTEELLKELLKAIILCKLTICQLKNCTSHASSQSH